jgi:hypothetical protein
MEKTSGQLSNWKTLAINRAAVGVSLQGMPARSRAGVRLRRSSAPARGSTPVIGSSSQSALQSPAARSQCTLQVHADARSAGGAGVTV